MWLPFRRAGHSGWLVPIDQPAHAHSNFAQRRMISHTSSTSSGVLHTCFPRRSATPCTVPTLPSRPPCPRVGDRNCHPMIAHRQVHILSHQTVGLSGVLQQPAGDIDTKASRRSLGSSACQSLAGHAQMSRETVYAAARTTSLKKGIACARPSY